MTRSRLLSVNTKTPSCQLPPQAKPSTDLHRVTVVLLVIAADLPSWMAVASFFKVASAETDSTRFLKSGIEMASSTDSIPKVMSNSSSDMPFIVFAGAHLLSADPKTQLSVVTN